MSPALQSLGMILLIASTLVCHDDSLALQTLQNASTLPKRRAGLFYYMS
jgi:hypothetical protein